MMSGKKLLFVGCNYRQIPYLKEAKREGFFVIGTDLNKDAPGIRYLDRFYNVGYEDVDGFIRIGKREKFNKQDKVFTAASQFAHLGAACFAKHFKIDYIPLEVVNLCLDKVRFYKLLAVEGIPHPKFNVAKTQSGIKRIIKTDVKKNYYVKSDFGKNPWHLYYVKNGKVPCINFKQDRYLRKAYVVQEEAVGRHIRVNYFHNRFIYFVHKEGRFFSCVDRLNKLQDQTECDLVRFVKSLKLEKRFIKFDLILNQNNYYVIDIGLDPPSRFRVLCRYLRHNFEKNYFLQNVGMQYSYPFSKNLVSADVYVSARKISKVK